jgi:hypothetical protein
LFSEPTVNAAPVEVALTNALQEPQKQPDQAEAIATAQAPAVAKAAASAPKEYKTGRIVFAIAFFLMLLGLAIAAEALDWISDTAKLYDYAGLVLAVIIGWLGGESTS